MIDLKFKNDLCYLNGIYNKTLLFSSPDDTSRAFQIACCRRPSVHPSVCKLSTFLSSSQEPLGQFQPNLAQSILVQRGFKFIRMKGHAIFQGRIITNLQKYIDEILKNYLLKNHWAKFKQTWHKASLGEEDSKEGPCPFPRGDTCNYVIAKIH